MANLNRRETAELLRQAARRMIERPDFEINNLAKLCTATNGILVEREKVSNKNFRCGFPQHKIIGKSA